MIEKHMEEDVKETDAQWPCLDNRTMHSIFAGLCSFSFSFLLQQGLSEHWSDTQALLHFPALLKPF